MSHLETELDQLKRDLHDMIDLVRSQLQKSKEATILFDTDLAQEVISNDRRVNGLELKIDRDCENILALYNPVAIDLRFVLAALKINHNLERIGDNAEGICRYVIDTEEKLPKNLLNEFQVPEMYDNAIGMLEDVNEAFYKEDTKMARKIFKKDDFLNETNKLATERAIKVLNETPEKTKLVLPVLSSVRKLERVGDLIKNLAEEIIFYIDAKVLKHKKKTVVK